MNSTLKTSTNSQVPGLNRRDFLKFGLAGAGLMLAPKPFVIGAKGNTSEDLQVALIGLGAQGRILMNGILRIPNIRIRAVCDIWDHNRNYGARFLSRTVADVNAYTDYRELLEKEKDLDAVIIATPDFWHAPMTNDALKAGLHVYCEKVMSNTIEGARSMVQTMRETGKLLQIGHQRRSNPRYLHTKNKILGSGMLGRITHANGQWNRAVSEDIGWPRRFAIPEDRLQQYGYRDMHQFRNWRWFRDLGGGPIADLGAHQIDIFNWFFGGPPKSIVASGGTDFYEGHEWYDNVMAIYEYDTPQGVARAFYQVLTTTSAGGGYYEYFMGTEGAVRISENPNWTQVFKEPRVPDWDEFINKNYVTSLMAGNEDPHDQVDSRESAAPDAYEIPVTLEGKTIHQPHLENFFAAIRGEAELNAPADSSFASEYPILRTNDAVAAQTRLLINKEDFTV